MIIMTFRFGTPLLSISFFFFRYFTLNHFRFPLYFFSFNILVVQNKVLLQRVKRWVKFLLVVVRYQPTMIYEWRKMSTDVEKAQDKVPDVHFPIRGILFDFCLTWLGLVPFF